MESALALYHGEIGECLALKMEKKWRVLSTLLLEKIGECLALKPLRKWRGKPTKQTQPFSMPIGPLNRPNNH